MVLNKISDNLVILVLSYNRVKKLKRSLESIKKGTHCPYEVIVIDGGSTDGSREFLESYSGITSIFQDRLIGPIKSLNQIWKNIDCRFTTWIDDDNEIVPDCLDQAIEILKTNISIGAVGLKMKDIVGPWAHRPYKGGLDVHSAMPFQHCVIRTDLLRSLGYANENYNYYIWNNDLTMSILSAGKSAVYLKQIAILHDRGWVNSLTSIEQVRNYEIQKKMKADSDTYKKRFESFLNSSNRKFNPLKRLLTYNLTKRILFPRGNPGIWGLNSEDWNCLIKGRFIRITDPIENIRNAYHLVQRIPENLLKSNENPYGHLVNKI